MTKITFIIGAVIALAVPTSGLLFGQNRPPVHWVSGGESIVVRQGDTIDFQAQFYSDVDIMDTSWCLIGRTGAALKPNSPNNHNNTCGYLGKLESNRITGVRFSVQIEQNVPPGLYPGELLVFKPKQSDPNGGAWLFPEYLHLKLYVMDANL